MKPAAYAIPKTALNPALNFALADCLAVPAVTPVHVLESSPPLDFPEQVIVVDWEMSEKFPEDGCYLRIQNGKSVDVVDLPGAKSLSKAKEMAMKLGFNPQHWLSMTSYYLSPLLQR